MLEGWRKPRIDHPDPKVRAEAFMALEPDDPSYVAALRSDEDLALRIGLVARLSDAALLHDLRSGGAGGELAAAADERLRGLIEGQHTEPEDGALLGDGSDVDLLEFAASSAKSSTLRGAAFAKLEAGAHASDALREALASSAPDAALRATAVAGLTDTEALERVAQAVRKSDKHVYRIAREKLAAQRAAAERAERRTTLLAELAELAARSLPGQNEALHRRLARLQNWQVAWRESAAGADADGAVASAAAGGSDPAAMPSEAAAAVTHIESLIAAARETVEQRRAVLHEIQEALANTGVAIAAEQLSAWRQRWAALSDHSESEQRELERGLAELESRSKDAQRQATLDSRAQTLLAEWESTDWDSAPVDKRRATKLTRLWDELAERGTLAPELHERYRALRDRLSATVERRTAEAESAGTELRAMVTELAAHLDAGQSAEATSLHDRLVHRLRTDAALSPGVVDGVRKRLSTLDPKLKELHEWRRWGAQQARDGLCSEADGLAAQVDSLKPGKLANRVKSLRQKWQTIDKGIGPAPDAQWTRFNTACEAAYAPAKALFEAQAAERKENAAKKRAVCERLEEYVRVTDWEAPDWDASTKLLDEARRQWRDIGGVTPKQFARLRKRYRLAVAGLDAKLAVERGRERKRRADTIERLRAGLEGQPLEDQIRAAKVAQGEWRPTVRLRRHEEQTLWQELRAVCDQIFARRDERFASRRGAESEALEARRKLCTELDALLPGDEPRDDAEVTQARGQFAQLRTLWQACGSVAPKDRSAVERRWRDASKALETRLAKHARRIAGKQDELLLTRALLAADRAQCAAHGDAVAAEQADTALQALPEQRGETARALAQAWQAASSATAQDGVTSDARRDVCVRLEMLAGVDSPPADQAQRMALKVALLSQAMSGEAQDAAARLHGLLCEWATAAVARPDDYAALRERFARAARALSGTD